MFSSSRSLGPKASTGRLFLLVLLFFFTTTAFLLGAGTRTQQSPQAEGPVHSSVDTGFPLELQDDLGNTVRIETKPQTIMSLSLFSDEVLLEMVPTSRFAAVSSIAQSEIYSNVASIAQQISPVVDFNVEQIISLFPDLVIAANWSEADKVAQLRQAGITVFQIDTPFTLDGIRSAIRLLGRLVGEPERAEDLIRTMDQRQQALEDRVRTIPAAQRVGAVDYNNWGTANGGDTTWNLVLTLAGIDNLVAHMTPGDFGQVPLSKELLIELDPEVLFLPGYIWGEEDGANQFFQQVINDPALRGLQALRNNRLYQFPERLKGTYSQFLIEAAETAARFAYPDLF